MSPSSPGSPGMAVNLPPMKVSSLTGSRSMRGPTSRYFDGKRSDHTDAGSITWSSTEMILGSSRMGWHCTPVSDGVSDSANHLLSEYFGTDSLGLAAEVRRCLNDSSAQKV